VWWTGAAVGKAFVRSFVNRIIQWGYGAQRFSWVVPVMLSMLLTMAAVATFPLIEQVLSRRHSHAFSYTAPLLVIGLASGFITFLAIYLYRKIAQAAAGEVTERIRISGELKNERILMRALMTSTPDHIFFKDRDGFFIRVNKSMAASFRLSDPSEANGKSESDFYPEATARLLQELSASVLTSGASVVGREHQIDWPGGREKWISLSVLPLRDRGARTVGTIVISRDITESKQAELQILQLSLAVEQSPSLVIITDKRGRITYVNPKFSQVTGYTRYEITGRNPRMLRAVKASDPVFRQMWRTVLSGGVWSGELLSRKKDGQTYWGFTSISPIHDPAGIITHYLITTEDVTKRKEAEQALRRQFAFQRQLIDAMPVPIFHKNARGIYQECNQAFAEFLGYDRSDVIGHTVFDISPPELAIRYHEHDQALMRQGGLQRYEAAVLHADGTRHEVMFTKALVHDDRGEVSGIVGAIMDLTNLRQTEAALQLENQRRLELESIVNKSPAVVFLWRAQPNWPVEFVTDSVRQFGYAPDDFISGGLPFASIVHPEDLVRVGGEVAEFSRNGTNEFTQQYRIFTKRGEVCWVDDRTWIRRDADGTITHYQGIVMDITERILASERQVATMTGLRAVLEMADQLLGARTLEELYQRAVELARSRLGFERTGILLVEGDKICGTFGTNLKGQTAREFDHVVELDERWRERMRPRKTGEKPWLVVSEPYFEWNGAGSIGTARGWAALTPITTQQGTIGFFSNDAAISGSPVDEVKQEIGAVMCALLGNIIARKKAESDQKTIQDQHREFMERTDRLNSLGMLAAGMAHEINNPLQGMLSHLHSVQKSLTADERARNSLEMVERGISTIATLVRKLLILGRQNLQESENVDCREAIEFVTQLLSSQFQQSRVRIQINAPAPSPIAAMPRRYLTQILLNLLINARDAMPEGGLIAIEMASTGQLVEIRITDTGVGIPASEMPNIFKPFHTTKGAKGTGLGLSVADSLARSSHGTISVESVPGKTTFTIKLPLAGGKP